MPDVALPQIAETQVVSFVLVLARVGGIFAFAPVFSSELIPARVRIAVAGAISLALTPLATRGQDVPTEATALAALLLKEIVVGLAFAIAIGALAAGVQAAGALIDTIVGFSFAAIVDPITNMQGAVLSQLYSVFVVMVFLLTGGDHLTVMGLARSYEVLPLGSIPDLGTLTGLVTGKLGDVFLIAVAIAAPVVLALVVVDAGLALVSRAVPQMNVFIVGLPAKILVGFGVIAVSLPFVAGEVRGELEGLVQSALVALRAA